MGLKCAGGASGGPEVGQGHLWCDASMPGGTSEVWKWAGALQDDLKWAGGTYAAPEVDRERLW